LENIIAAYQVLARLFVGCNGLQHSTVLQVLSVVIHVMFLEIDSTNFICHADVLASP
jgi:hypothetical protein